MQNLKSRMYLDPSEANLHIEPEITPISKQTSLASPRMKISKSVLNKHSLEEKLFVLSPKGRKNRNIFVSNISKYK